MVKIFLNTPTFDALIKKQGLAITTTPAEADVLVLGAKKIDYTQFPKIKVVYRFGVGAENVDFDYLKSRNIPVVFPSPKAKNILFEATANFTVYGILKLYYQNACGDVATWKKQQRAFEGDQRALVIGTGNIGAKVAAKLKSFFTVDTFDALNNKPEELKALIEKADIITIHVPATSETKNLFNAERLAWIKDNAIIANTARGELFDEEALYQKLKTSNCRAFFDVFWQEPYLGKLKELPADKFFMTPHTASNAAEFVTEGFNDILNIVRELSCPT